MTSRDKKLATVLGVVGIGGAGFVGHQLVVAPIQENDAEYAKLDDKSLETQSRLDDILANAKKLSAAKKRSLPADIDVARREYEAMLGKLLRGAGVPSGFTITPRDPSNSNGVYLLAPKKPAYARIGFEIRIQKVDLTTLSKFLYDYYQLNLLHQITKLDIKRADQDGSVGFRRGSASDQRADLEVNITTEGIILDGAESRRSLLPISPAVAAAAGGVGYYAVTNTPEVSRNIKPIQYPTRLATNSKDGLTPTRDYGVLAAKDPFHGPLPPPEKPKPVEKPKEVVVVAPPPKPKEDISPFIRLNGMMWSSDGTVEATIWDKAFNHYYEIRSRVRDGKTEFKVVKFYMLGEKRKPFYSETDLIVGEDETATNRTFKIVGIVDDGIVLIDKTPPEAPPADAKAAVPTIRKPDERDKPTIVTMNRGQLVQSALVGGSSVALTPTPEKVFFWRVDQTLASLKPLNADDAKALLSRVTQPAKTTIPTTAPLPGSPSAQAQATEIAPASERLER